MEKRKTSNKTEKKYQKIFSILDRDVLCMHRYDDLLHTATAPLHNHDGYEILLFLQGETNYYVESGGKKLEYGEVILTTPYAFHCAIAQPGKTYERILINIKDSYLNTLCSKNTDLAFCFKRLSANMLNSCVLTESEIHDFIETAHKLQHEIDCPGYGSDLLIPALLTQILVFLNQKTMDNPLSARQNFMPKIVADTINYVNGNFQDDISLASVASNLHHNGNYISRRFKEVTGTTLQQFIIAKRITMAQKYLREGSPVNDACFMSGFSNYANFSRCFSKHIGMSPKQYQMTYTTQISI